jgi:hypothetical protein
MTQTKTIEHTPGPWYVQELERGTQIIYANDGATVICEGPDSMKYPTSYRAWSKANARLIAAAPELARENAELREQVAQLLQSLEFLLNPDNVALTHAQWGAGCNSKEVREAIDKAKQAIAKAKGEA